MPELPEVEVVRLQLQQRILGKKIQSVQAEPNKIVNFDTKISTKLRGLEFVAVERVGKLLIFRTSKPDIFVLCHLKMTGQLIFSDQGSLAGGGHTLAKSDLELPHKHTHVVVEFEDKSRLYFNDMRKFGYFKIASLVEVEKEKNKFGVEPISEQYDFGHFQKILKHKKTSIKAFLLNQKYLAGLGNIYVDEACFRAKIAPQRIAGNLNRAEQKDLFEACRQVLLDSIREGGTTFYNFMDTTEGKGGYSRFLQVFQREGQSCLRCGGIVQKEKLAGRGTHWCSECQK